MFEEIYNIIICVAYSIGMASIVSYVVDIWYSHPLKEEEGGSILYINKELNLNE